MESFAAVAGLVLLVLVIVFIGKKVKRTGMRAAIAHGNTLADRVDALGDKHRAQTESALEFADPIAGRSVVARALGSLTWVHADGDDAWRIGEASMAAHVAADWRVVDGRGVLAAARTTAVGELLAGGANWAKALDAVAELAAREGVAVERTSAPFAATAETVGGGVVWVRA